MNENEEQLDEVLAAFLEAEGAGWAPRPEQMLRCYPHLAEDIRQFFADRERVERITRSLSPSPPPSAPSLAEEPPSSVRGETGWPHVPGYEIQEEIARGGMGVIYKARQAGLNRVVALKM